VCHHVNPWTQPFFPWPLLFGGPLIFCSAPNPRPVMSAVCSFRVSGMSCKCCPFPLHVLPPPRDTPCQYPKLKKEACECSFLFHWLSVAVTLMFVFSPVLPSPPYRAVSFVTFSPPQLSRRAPTALPTFFTAFFRLDSFFPLFPKVRGTTGRIFSMSERSWTRWANFLFFSLRTPGRCATIDWCVRRFFFLRCNLSVSRYYDQYLTLTSFFPSSTSLSFVLLTGIFPPPVHSRDPPGLPPL